MQYLIIPTPHDYQSRKATLVTFITHTAMAGSMPNRILITAAALAAIALSAAGGAVLDDRVFGHAVTRTDTPDPTGPEGNGTADPPATVSDRATAKLGVGTVPEIAGGVLDLTDPGATAWNLTIALSVAPYATTTWDVTVYRMEDPHGYGGAEPVHTARGVLPPGRVDLSGLEPGWYAVHASRDARAEPPNEDAEAVLDTAARASGS